MIVSRKTPRKERDYRVYVYRSDTNMKKPNLWIGDAMEVSLHSSKRLWSVIPIFSRCIFGT